MVQRTAMELQRRCWTLTGSLTGLAIAGERRRLLAWNDAELLLADYSATIQAKRSFTRSKIVAAAVDVAAEHIVVALKGWGLLTLDATLRKRWSLPVRRPVSVSCSPFAERIAVGTEDGNLVLLDRYGRSEAQITTVRPARWSVFIAQQPALYVAGDSTFLSLMDLALRAEWDERIWSPIGPLATPGSGAYVLVTTFTYGLERYRRDGVYEGGYQIRDGTRWVSVDYDGGRIVAASLDRHLVLLDASGVVRADWAHEAAELVGLCLSPEGELLFVAYSDGRLERIEC